MSLSIHTHPLVYCPKIHPKFLILTPRIPTISISTMPKHPKLFSIKSANGNHERSPVVVSEKPKWEIMLENAASLYPLYVTVGGIVACVKPSTFSWFVERGPSSFSFSLGFIMLAMGITLNLKDLLNLFMQRPLSILFGCVAQYTIMPAFGYIISKTLGLPPSLSVGLILLACCPGGTASNVILAGTYVPVDAVKLSISTLQVVVIPILLGSYLQSTFPSAIKIITPFSPIMAVLASSFLACSVFSENVALLKSLLSSASMASDLSPLLRVQAIFSGEFGAVILSVLLLHFAGFFVGYLAAAIGGFRESQRRAISIEVGMQNSSLGVVLATSHFTSQLVALPPAMSAVIMNIMGSSLGLIWRYISPPDSNEGPKVD